MQNEDESPLLRIVRQGESLLNVGPCVTAQVQVHGVGSAGQFLFMRAHTHGHTDNSLD